MSMYKKRGDMYGIFSLVMLGTLLIVVALRMTNIVILLVLNMGFLYFAIQANHEYMIDNLIKIRELKK